MDENENDDAAAAEASEQSDNEQAAWELAQRPTDFLASGLRVGQTLDASEMLQFGVTTSGAVRGENAPAKRFRITAVAKHAITVEEET